MDDKMSFQFILLIIIFPCLLCQNPSNDLELFMELNHIHQRYLQHVSMPEMSHMFRLPPFKYWTQNSSFTSASQIMDDVENIGILLHSSLNEAKRVSKCSADLTQFLFNLNSDWALQMIDSYGKLDSGVSSGSNIWPGSYRECLSVYAPILETDDYSDFHGRYCVVTWKANVSQAMPEVPLSVGICVPDSCSAHQINNTLTHIGQDLANVTILSKLSSYLQLKTVECKYDPQSPDGAVITFVCVLVLFLLLVFIGSALTVYNKFKKLDDQSSVKCEANLQVELNKDRQLSLERSHTHSVDHIHPLVNEEVLMPKLTQKKKFDLKDILLCFCAFTNGAKVLNTDVPSGQMLSLHGIRFLSLTWVIMGHTYISAVAMIENKLEVLKDIDNFPFQMVMQAPFSVDSFFLLSGFLVTYLFLKEMDKRKGKMNWIYFYGHRIWRLTPVYMIIVLFYMLIFKYLGSGPFWDENHGDSCRHTFWWYLLYISNFIPVKDMCVGWSWYLANDMQFYVISPLFLYPLWRWPKIGIAVISSFLCASWVVTAVLSYQYDLIPMFVGVTKATDLKEYQDTMWYAFDMIYDKPYCRIGPYLIGAYLGYIMFKIGNRRHFLTWYHQVIGWTLAIFFSASVVFGLYHVDNNLVTGMFYNALCRSSFSLGLAWVIFACEIGHGGIVYKFLSMKFWVPLSRLTFCAYLVHLMLIHGYYQGLKVVLYFTQVVMVTNFFGFLILAYILAFIVSIMFESPMLNLEKLLLKRTR